MLYLYFGGVFFLLGVFWSVILVSNLETCLMVFDFGSIFSIDKFEVVFLLDFFKSSFLLVLSFMVSSVFFFSYYYMVGTTYTFRFVGMLMLFVLSMQILMISPKLFIFLLGWDGLGFTSFLLVAWFGCFSSWSASMKTFLLNRLGDALFLLGFVFVFWQGHFKLFFFDSSLSVFVGLVFIFATFTKSAQFPFSSWLPAAMSAPTPVSSLVHSSTLVTAGIYFLIRFSSLFTSSGLMFISVLGLLTMCFASFCAIFEMDLKKVVAFSTLSQLGFMCFCVGVGFIGLAYFYLLVHACFKALMFISVGVYMVFGGHSQDFRSLKNLWCFNPMVFMKIFVSVVSLSGIPFLSGFVLKDVMVFMFSVKVIKIFLVVIFLVSLVLTGVYAFRLFYLLSFGTYKFVLMGFSFSMSFFVFLPLYICSIFLGYIFDSFFLVFLKMSFLQILCFTMFIFFGVILGVFSYCFSLMKSLYLYSWFSLIFFCSYMKISFNSFFYAGSKLFYFLDSGKFSLKFMDSLNNLFSFRFKYLYSFFFSVGWLSLILVSYLFVYFVFVV